MTFSESPFSSMYLMTAASSAPGWIQIAGTPDALACSRTPRVICCDLLGWGSYHGFINYWTFGGVMTLIEVSVGLGRSETARSVFTPSSSASFYSDDLMDEINVIFYAVHTYRVKWCDILASREIPLQNLKKKRNL